MQPREAACVESERHAPLVVIHEIEERRRATAGAIRSFGAFDLHHPGAALLQQVRTQRSSPQRGKVHDLGRIEPLPGRCPCAVPGRDVPRLRACHRRRRETGRKSQQPRALNECCGIPRGHSRDDGLPGANVIFLEPRWHVRPVSLTSQTDGEPAVRGSQHAAAATGSDGAMAMQSRNGSAFAEQCGAGRQPRGAGADGGCDAMERLEGPVRAACERHRAHLRRTVRVSGQSHESAASPRAPGFHVFGPIGRVHRHAQRREQRPRVVGRKAAASQLHRPARAPTPVRADCMGIHCLIIEARFQQWQMSVFCQ